MNPSKPTVFYSIPKPTMRNKFYFLVLLAFFGADMNAQSADSFAVEIDTVEIDTTVLLTQIHNPKALRAFYQKLSDLERYTKQKIHIVHIGDSHIQADLMTHKVRKNLQNQFGNAGRGFVFPHAIARTNGSSDIIFSSNSNWESYRNIYPVNGNKVGLSGIALASKSNDFTIELNVKEVANEFNTIKIITPGNKNSFNLAVTKKARILVSNGPKKITHTIKKGEALSLIAEKYKVTIAEIKYLNQLKSNAIRAGKTLKIPTSQTQTQQEERAEFIPLKLLSDMYSHYYKSEKTLDKIYLLPNKESDEFVLSGVVLENDNPGVLYHNIGVNGAKLSDFNKYPLFFEQLRSLQPDLIIISLGTNESFETMSVISYMEQLNLFLLNLKSQNPNAAILVSTPPPSLFQRKIPNTLVADYALEIRAASTENTFAVWDMFSDLGGLNGISRNAKNGLIGKDRVHYSKAGYELQAQLLTEALLKGFQDFKN